MPRPSFVDPAALARRLLPVFIACAAACSLPAHAVTFTELGDAGQTQGTAQSTLGTAGALTAIVGSLGSTTDADLYVINISSPGSFSAQVVSTGGILFDTQLFLLTLSGAPVYFNDDQSGVSTLSALPSGSSFGPVATGSYLLGIAASGYNPANASNQLLFGNAFGTGVYGPASGLQPAVLGMFSNDTFYDQAGAYQIQLSGVGAIAAAVPEPSSALLLGLGGLAGAWAVRRRRPGAGAAAA